MIHDPSPPLAAARQSESLHRAVRGGNHTGLSLWGAQEAWRHAATPGSHGLILIHGPENLRVIRLTAPEGMVRKDGLDSSHGPWMDLKDGGGILVRRHTQSITSFTSMGVDWIWIDGVPRIAVLQELLAMNVHQPIWMTFTPIGGEVGALRIHMEGEPEKAVPPENPWEQYIVPLTPANVPWRSLESIHRQIEGTPAEEYAQRILGEWEGGAP